MGVAKAYLGVALALLLPASSGAGQIGVADQAQLFADCAGRLSASIEFQWLMRSGDGARELELRAGFDGLIAAILPDALAAGLDGPALLHRRIGAKFAQARLLHTAQFHGDRRRTTRARLLASRHRAACEALLPG